MTCVYSEPNDSIVVVRYAVITWILRTAIAKPKPRTIWFGLQSAVDRRQTNGNLPKAARARPLLSRPAVSNTYNSTPGFDQEWRPKRRPNRLSPQKSLMDSSLVARKSHRRSLRRVAVELLTRAQNRRRAHINRLPSRRLRLYLPLQ